MTSAASSSGVPAATNSARPISSSRSAAIFGIVGPPLLWSAPRIPLSALQGGEGRAQRRRIKDAPFRQARALLARRGRWEGEGGAGQPSGIPHLTPTLSAPQWSMGGGEGVGKALRPAP